MQNSPAHATKHISELDYLLPDRSTRVLVHQDDSTANSTGRTVWLGAQVLSVYLHDLLSSKSSPAAQQRPRAIDLGSGTGLVALSLASMGYDALATDVDMIVQGVLHRNVEANAAKLSGRIKAETLDWCTFDRATWSASTSANVDSVDLLTTADTVYDPSLSAPLLQTLHGLSLLFAKPAPPPVYLALEARDPALISAFFALAASEPFGFKCSRVDPDRIRKLVEAKDGTLGWQDESDWEGVEVWKMVLSKKEVARAKAERKAAAG
ncbi:hypothetical protein BMF94_6749 [Rhodotorula taiwanensis]|uniref:Uncharacterized protein n=1 Tax=Rhodotorula taiwanensis TaxID=741276 RepID=A0A2S5B067_9BASI|nr:hypothetical protein BMF94_6749 [Rhodotorula taiwanensis]